MKRPIILDSVWVRPFDAGMDPMVCMTCSEPCARWAVGKPPNGYFSCARCFLYTSPWGKENAVRLKEFVLSVESAMGRQISVEGVVTPKEADRILSSIVAVSGVARARARKRTRDEGPWS
jgi:hypothetical protein